MGTRPFSQLPEFFDQIERRSERALKRTVRETAKNAGRVAIRETPVRTGLARSNWVATIGAPNSSTISPYKPGPPWPKRPNSGKGERANAQGARNQVDQVVDTWQLNSGTIFITNNVSYIEQINFGGSTNQAQNMLAKAVQSANASVLGLFKRSFRAGRVDRTLQIGGA